MGVGRTQQLTLSTSCSSEIKKKKEKKKKLIFNPGEENEVGKIVDTCFWRQGTLSNTNQEFL